MERRTPTASAPSDLGVSPAGSAARVFGVEVACILDDAGWDESALQPSPREDLGDLPAAGSPAMRELLEADATRPGASLAPPGRDGSVTTPRPLRPRPTKREIAKAEREMREFAARARALMEERAARVEFD